MPQINPASANSKGIPMRAPNARRVPILSPGDSAAVIHPRLLSESISKPPKEYIMPATIPIKQKSVAWNFAKAMVFNWVMLFIKQAISYPISLPSARFECCLYSKL